MDKKKIIAEIASRHGALVQEDDPAFYIVDLAVLAVDQKIEEIQAAIEKGERSIPQAIDSKQTEIAETAAKLLAASDSLEARREGLAAALKRDVDKELRSNIDNYISQILSATKEMIEYTIRAEIANAAPALQEAAQALDQARRAQRRSYLHDILWMVIGGLVSGIAAVFAFVRLF